MKKLLYLMPLVMLGACNLDNDNDMSQTNQYVTANLLVPEDVETEPSACVSTYSITQYPNKGTMDMTTSELKFDGVSCNFAVSDVPSRFGISAYGEAADFSAAIPVVTSGKVVVSNLAGQVTPFYYYYQSPLENVLGGGMFGPRLVMSYNLAGVGKVITFPFDAFYSGTTMTTYPDSEGGQKNFTTDEILYKVNMSVEKKLANVIIYKARFAEEMPADKVPEALVLKNLTVEFTRDGYRIKGTDIIPQLVEGGQLVPMPRYTFNEFLLTTSDENLTKVRCGYQVAGIYSGTFSGAYFHTPTAE